MKTKILIRSLSVILLIGAIYGVCYYFSFFQGNYTVIDNKVKGKNLVDKDFTPIYKSNSSFTEVPVKEVCDITISLFSTPLNEIPVLQKGQRYYFPLEAIASQLEFSINNREDSIILSKGDNTSILYEKYYKDSLGNTHDLRGHLINYNNKAFISVSDAESIFGLLAYFQYEDKIINFLNIDSKTKNTFNTSPSIEGRVAMIRLEDFTSGGECNKEANLPKYKSMALLMSNFNVKYHIAWIPRYVSPPENIDNDLEENENFENAAFINLLDFFINNNGSIGLHGYRHQYENDISGEGSELTSTHNTSDEEVKKVLESSIDTATLLNIPYDFFETPHYQSTTKQKKVIEQYFKYIYESRNIFIFNKVSSTRNNNLYVPTPLDYLYDEDPTPIVNKLKNPRPNQLCSFFYHPTIELNFINYTLNTDSILIDYSTDAPLYQISKTLMDEGFTTIHITSLHK